VDGTGCSHALVCPYHGWTYRLDGSLSHVPHADSFPGLDMSSRGLVEVASAEVDGLIVIGAVELADGEQTTEHGERGAGPDLGTLADGAPWRDDVLPATELTDTTSSVRPMNWKVLVEQFLEGYHIRTTHRETFFPLQYDDLNVVETFGPNSRVTYPYRNIERLRERPESTWSTRARVTYVYQLFPNVMIATFPDRVILVAVDPVDVEHSTLTLFSMVDPGIVESRESDVPSDVGAPSVDRQDRASRGRSLVERGGLEDDAMSVAVQRGLHAGANAFVEFGRHESAIGHFHRVLDDRLAARVRRRA
jgi:phenylpropionate dioxygenase-like ring-hydroxylating dioxygenase large terminal subunit